MTTTIDTITDKLRALIGKGYRFVHPRDAAGDVVAIVGVRVHNNVIDLVRVHGEDEAIATRAPADETDVLRPKNALWEYRGAADDVIDTVLSQPDIMPAQQPAQQPAQEPAERSVSRRAATGCWVGDDRGRSRWLTATA
ncbi:MAG: hypothetical protein GEU98_04045 [Pseudonocardiaceae bacterium]|nr:hypothetical protein [Pseudonocardiaceae bacterium]